LQRRWPLQKLIELSNLVKAIGFSGSASVKQLIDPIVKPVWRVGAAATFDGNQLAPLVAPDCQKSNLRRSISSAIAAIRGSPLSHIVFDHLVMSSWSVQVARASGVSGGCESLIIATA
jgi:hypothetical protein